jgi:hypothetical protein
MSESYGVHGLPGDSAIEDLADDLRRSLTSVKIRDADSHNDQTRNLLLQHMDSMPPGDVQVIIRRLRMLV